MQCSVSVYTNSIRVQEPLLKALCRSGSRPVITTRTKSTITRLAFETQGCDMTEFAAHRPPLGISMALGHSSSHSWLDSQPQTNELAKARFVLLYCQGRAIVSANCLPANQTAHYCQAPRVRHTRTVEIGMEFKYGGYPRMGSLERYRFLLQHVGHHFWIEALVDEALKLLERFHKPPMGTDCTGDNGVGVDMRLSRPGNKRIRQNPNSGLEQL